MIYLDSDDVLFDFTGHYLDWWGVSHKESEITKWDFLSEIGHHQEQFDLTLANPDFWDSQPPSKYARDLLRAVGYRFSVVSASPLNGRVYEAKIRTLTKLLEEERISMPEIHFCHDKSVLARPHDVLIDDKIENCDAFVLRKGKAVLWPTPTNRSSVTKTVGVILPDSPEQALKIIGNLP